MDETPEADPPRPVAVGADPAAARTPALTTAEERARRLAAALRENLRRRKAQSRGRGAATRGGEDAAG